MSNKEFSSDILAASKWSALGELISRFSQPLSYAILARFLSPEDFGVVAIAVMVVAFAQIFWDGGLGKLIIQTSDENLNEVINSAFWLNLLLAGIVYGGVVLTSGFIAKSLSASMNSNALAIQAVTVVIGALSSVQRSLFQRVLKFKPLFYSRLIASLVPFLVTIPLAILGCGYWSIIIASISAATLETIFIWRFSDWRPSLPMRIKALWPHKTFALWVTGEAFLSWLITWGDSLIVSKMLSAGEVGKLRYTSVLVASFFGLIFNPLLPVLYASFSRVNSTSEMQRQLFLRANRTLIPIMIGAATLIFICRDMISFVLVSNSWGSISNVLTALVFVQTAGWLVGINSELYRAIGRPDYNVKIMLVAIAYYTPLLIIGAHIGFNEFLISRCLAALIAIPIHAYVARQVASINVREQMNVIIPPVLAFFPVAACSYFLKLSAGEWSLVIILPVLIVFYVAAWIVVVKSNRAEFILVYNQAALKIRGIINARIRN